MWNFIHSCGLLFSYVDFYYDTIIIITDYCSRTPAAYEYHDDGKPNKQKSFSWK